MAESKVGTIIGYYTNISVAAIKMEAPLKVGDTIHIKGATTDITQKVDSMQYDHAPVKDARTGQSVGIKVSDRVREHDKVYKIQ